jgi:hypothetical protein
MAISREFLYGTTKLSYFLGLSSFSHPLAHFYLFVLVHNFVFKEASFSLNNIQYILT